MPIAYVALRILLVANRLSGLAILALLTATFVAPDWTMTALGITAESSIRTMLPGLQAIAGLGLLAVLLNDIVIRHLLEIVRTVGRGDPFTAANAHRLLAMAWLLLGLQVISLIVGAIGKAIETAANPLNLDAGFSPAGWLGVLLTFVLAGIFSEGTKMRDDLDGTI
ncbi:DUF2975 domain-containing protein [Sphingoaurantiacus capsulatus]|uniref:DUF2975 domain-containing protein n=1 Tax=Sphingoaurantiacus capsulatus TaxID=1771310 RepID=A0ABV7X7P7_9SPHN